MWLRAGKVGRWLCTGLIAVILQEGTGCSGGRGPKTYPVNGRIESSSAKQWTGGTLTFKSADEPAMLATGEIQEDGSFTLTTYYAEAGVAKSQAGAVAGEHTVTLVEPGPPEGSGRAARAKPVLLPRRYRIEAGENFLVIDLPRLGKN